MSHSLTRFLALAMLTASLPLAAEGDRPEQIVASEESREQADLIACEEQENSSFATEETREQADFIACEEQEDSSFATEERRRERPELVAAADEETRESIA